ncbi:hypothetical protein ACFQ1I_23135 [Kitasatospora arboriphila]
MVKTPYHEGEQAVQQRAGEGHPGWGSPMFEAAIPPPFDMFLRRQRMLVIGGVDDDGAAWSTVLTGPRGFAGAVGSHTIHVKALPVAATRWSTSSTTSATSACSPSSRRPASGSGSTASRSARATSSSSPPSRSSATAPSTCSSGCCAPTHRRPPRRPCAAPPCSTPTSSA